MRRPDRPRHPFLLVAWLLTGLSVVGSSFSAGQPPGPDAEEQIKRLVVMIRGKLAGNETIGAGIIFGLGSDRLYIATANHVVRQGTQDEAQDLRVQFRWLPGERIEANLLTDVDHPLDLAVLSVLNPQRLAMRRDTLPFDRLGDPGVLKRRDPVYFVGYPNGKPWHSRVTPDPISQTSADVLKFESTFLAQGHSGGALVNDRWELVGMVRSDQPPDGEAVRIEAILEKLRQWNYPVNLSTRSPGVGPMSRAPGPSPPPADPPRRADRPAGFLSLSPGAFSTCGLMSGGIAYCWGSNRSGELGNGSQTSSHVPVPVSGGLVFRLVTAQGPHACGVIETGAASCWGLNLLGRLGTGSQSNSPIPVPVSGGLSFRSVSAGYTHTCGITADGAVYCWGGQLGNGSQADSPIPVRVSGGLSFRFVSAGGGHSCGITTEGAAYCWGRNRSGELGNGSQADSPVPVPVSGGRNLGFRLISAGLGHTCGLTSGGGAYCWGKNGSGELGNGSQGSSTTPLPVSGGLSFRYLSAGAQHTCGITTEAAAYCWGDNGSGELGNGSLANSATPVPVSGRLTFRMVRAGGRSHTCGITTEGAAYCWGENRFGQLGNGSNVNSSVPVPVSGPS